MKSNYLILTTILCSIRSDITHTRFKNFIAGNILGITFVALAKKITDLYDYSDSKNNPVTLNCNNANNTNTSHIRLAVDNQNHTHALEFIKQGREAIRNQDIDLESLSTKRGLTDTPEIQLVEASKKGDVEKMKELLDQGASPNANDTGLYALEAAAICGQKDAVKLLISKNAHIESWWYETKVPARANCLATKVHPRYYPENQLEEDLQHLSEVCKILQEAKTEQNKTSLYKK